jgi:predicted nucleotidyltransferase component of viral defense system
LIPQAHITAWRATAPWADDAQVEQDLVLSRAVVQLFSAPGLADRIALRGGTALSKLFVQPGCRYSEDIDVVQMRSGSAGPLIDSMRAVLDPWLGRPQRGRATHGFELVYRFESEIAPVRPLRLKLEANTREHFSVLGFQRRRLSVANPWFSGDVELNTYALDELMGTKMRALYQRRKGRDLFDLWLCLERGLIEPAAVVQCFLRYMEHEGHAIARDRFEHNLHDKENDPAFMGDIRPLLQPDLEYDPRPALDRVRADLIARLPGEPWRGDAH